MRRIDGQGTKARIPTEHDRYIGQRIREARVAAGMSQTDLASLHRHKLSTGAKI